MKATCILLLVFLALLAGADERLDRLPPKYRAWLEAEVVYIMTDTERDVFLSLRTVEERDRFIEAFWRLRDPDPATLVNEFEVEHYRRLQYANEKLSRETARPGWKTDRGRMYVILGEPQSISRFEAMSELVQCELWFYSADPSKGIPSAFNLLFFRRRDLGEYELYHPALDGPNVLVKGYQFTPAAETGRSLSMLQRISPELARASLSLDLGEPVDFANRRPSLATDILLSRIEESPKRAARTDYAAAHLRYGHRVSADYSFRFVPSRFDTAVLYGPEGARIVHYTVELAAEDFALERTDDGSKYHTTLEVTTEVTDLEGRPVVLEEREDFLELAPSEFQAGAALPFAYQDAFPLVPGSYRMSVVLRNRVLHRYTVAEAELLVPEGGASPRLSDLVLGYLHETPLVREGSEHDRAFQVGSDRIYPAAEGVFSIGDVVYAFAQLDGGAEGHRLRFALQEGERILEEKERKLEGRSPEIAVESFSLMDVTGGTYAVRAQLVDPAGRVLEERTSPLFVSPRTGILRPGLIYRRGFASSTPGLLALRLGEQLWSLGRFAEAAEEFARAVAANNPELPEARWKLAASLLSAGEPRRALELLEPMERAFPEQFEVIAGLGYGHYFSESYQRAVEYLTRALELRPPDTTLLNTLGRSYLALGEEEKAMEAFRRSYQLDPSQEDVRKLLDKTGSAVKP